MLESFQQVGASLGVGILGTVFSSGLGMQADAAEFVHVAMRVTPLTIGLTALTFVGRFLLPMCVATAAQASIPAYGR